MNILKRVTVILIVVFGNHILTASESVVFSPAAFDGGPQSIENLIFFPDVDGDVDIFINCDSEIGATGRFNSDVCFSEDESTKSYEKSILSATKKARIKPASINGKKVSVYFQYMVNFQKKGTKENIHVYSNHGENRSVYGLNYNSPQRYRKGVANYSSHCLIRRMNVWIKSIIDTEGNPTNIGYAGGNGKHEWCVASLIRKFEKGRFIPAFHDGVPVSAIYVESFHNVEMAKRR